MSPRHRVTYSRSIPINKLPGVYRQFRSHITPRTVIAGAALVVVAGAWIAFAQMTGTTINPATLRVTLAQFGVGAPLALIVALVGVLVIPIIPATVFQVGAGLVFGPFLGLIYVLIADVLGASIGFWLARHRGRSLLARYLSPATQARLANLTERITGRGVILLRLLPGPAYPLVSLAAGYSSLGYARYILASFVGVFPGLALLVLAGDLVERSPALAFALVALLLVGLVIAGRGLSRQARDGKDADAK